ncbi:MAG: hypothetical protein ACOH1N_12170 [Lutibacter sp.]
MKKLFLKIGMIIFLFYSCEEVFFEDDISEAAIGLIGPTDNTILDTQHVIFNWSILEGAEEFQLQIATPSFLNASQVVLDTLLTKSTFEIELSPNDYQWRVRAINSAYTTNYSTSSFQIITLNTNEKIKLISPENNLISNNTTQHLSWQSVDYANNYRLQLWKPDTSGEKVQDIVVKSNDTIINFNEGTYIWQVRAENDQNYTTYSSRSILIDATAPNIAQLATPVNLKQIINRTIQFSWERENMEGSAELDSLFLFQNETLTQIAYKEKIAVKNITLELTPNTYYWYVKSYDIAGNKSDRSEVFSFTVLEGITQRSVILISPEDNLITNISTQTFSWNSLEYADDYRFQVLKANGTNELVFDVASNEITKTLAFQDGLYHWQVRAQNTTQNTEYTKRSILIDTKAPNIPTQIMPGDKFEQVEKVIHFQMERQAIDGSAEKDSLFVYADVALTNLELKTTVNNNNHYQEFAPGTYYWYLRAYDKAGNKSAKSNLRSFTILEDFTLRIVELIAPTDELITNTAQQTLQWNAVEGASDYRVLIHKVNSNVILKDYILPITSKTIIFEDGYYTWKVRAQNKIQNTQYTSRNILIDTTPPNISVLQSPANEQVLNNTTVHFIWSRETINGSVEKSMVYVYTDADLTNLVFSSKASENSLYRDMTPGVYYWYVKTGDEAGNLSDKSIVFSFTIE